MLTLQNFELIGSVSVSLTLGESQSYRYSATPATAIELDPSLQWAINLRNQIQQQLKR